MGKVIYNSNPSEDRITLISLNKKSNQNNSLDKFYSGLYCLHQNQLKKAKRFFLTVLNETEKFDELYGQCLSFLGLVEVVATKSSGGLHRCYTASKEYPNDPEVFLNIAFAEFLLGNRMRCVSAIKKSLKIDPDNQQVQKFYQCIGKRKKHRSGNKAMKFQNVFGRLLRDKSRSCLINSFNDILRRNLSLKLDAYVEDVINNNK